jgi:Tetracyclin repressor-like, C-terminal domain
LPGPGFLIDGTAVVEVREVVHAVLDPYIELIDADPENGLRWMKVFTQLAMRHNEIWVQELGNDPSLVDLFVKAARRALPDLQTAKARTRCGIAMVSMTVAVANSDLPAYGSPWSTRGIDRRWLAQLVEFTSGGLRGDTTGGAHPAPRSASTDPLVRTRCGRRGPAGDLPR